MNNGKTVIELSRRVAALEEQQKLLQVEAPVVTALIDRLVQVEENMDAISKAFVELRKEFQTLKLAVQLNKDGKKVSK